MADRAHKCFVKLFIILPVLLFIFDISCIRAAEASPAYLTLNGVHKANRGDDAAWKSPDFDDSTWNAVYLPSSFNLLDSFSPYGVVWYRIRFTAPASLKDMQTGVFLGRIGDADETYLNGLKIGWTGNAAEEFVEAGNVYRLYKIPSGLLKIDRENVLAVRTLYTQSYWGFFDENILIGDYNRLLVETTRKAHKIEIFETSFITGLLLVLAGCSFLYIHGTREREYVYLWFFVAAYASFFILDTNMFYSTGIQTPAMQRSAFVFLTLGAVFLTMFLTHACGAGVTAFVKTLVFILIVVAFSHLIPLPAAGKKLLFSIRMLTLAATAVYYLYVSAKAYLGKKNEAGIILAGVLFYVAGSRTELMSGITFQKYSGLFLIDYAMALFLICMIYAMTARFTRIKKSLKLTAEKVMAAHEEERKRIARDIHDVVGQGLLAIKLNLQMLNSKIKNCENVSPDDFERLIAETSSYIDEVRLIAMDLRPSFIDSMDFADSLLWHAKNFEKKTGVAVAVKANTAGNLSGKIKDNLYRIYQEALSNAVRHSGADMIKVECSTEGGLVRLKIADNGRGFNISSPEILGKGVGLESVWERAQLIGGSCAIKSSDKGTIITVEVKIHD